MIERASDGMQRLIRSMLQYAQAGEGALRLQPVSVSELMESVLLSLGDAMATTNARVICSPLPQVEADPVLLEQVFQNLIANAIRYRKPEQAPIIEIRAEALEQGWRFTVSDNGQGILHDYLQTVFEPLKRLHGHEIPGSGLGLAICKAIVTRHGGRIGVESEGSGRGRVVPLYVAAYRKPRPCCRQARPGTLVVVGAPGGNLFFGRAAPGRKFLTAAASSHDKEVNMDNLNQPELRDDSLNYLARSVLRDFPKRTVIYDKRHPSEGLYLVMLGRVKLELVTPGAPVTLTRIVTCEGFFGESALVNTENRESAVTMDASTVMHWSRAEIEQQIDREPRLGLSLSQFFIRQSVELQDRIEGMAIQKTPRRVMLALLQLARTIGTPAGDGSVRIGSLTHRTLAEYLGTSREIVTFQLNRLRRLGLIKYSRQFIDIYDQAVQDELQQQRSVQ